MQAAPQKAFHRSAALLPLSDADKADFGHRPLVATHNLQQSELFTDAALIDLLDRFPRKNVYALTMGTDPARPEENRLALHDGVSGTELLQAVKKGRLWLNITRVDRADARYRALIDQLYEELAAQVTGFSPSYSQGTLLISSPHALVYYHADGPASVLWHIRGRKRVWVYPALDSRYVERAALEDIFAGVRHEYLPFDPRFDAGATVYDLEPGQWIAWAQNAPHRVTNFDSINVSLSTEHFTPQSRARARVYVANRFFRTKLGLTSLAAREQGLAALTKTLIHRIASKVGLEHSQMKRHEPTMRVDPDAEGGVVPLGSVRTHAAPLAIEVRCFTSFASAAFLRDEVNALNGASGRPDPFSTFEFFENFLRHDEFFPAGQGLNMWFLTAFAGGRLLGYLALKRVTHNVLGMQVATLGFLVTHDTDRPHLVARPESVAQVSAAFYQYVLGRKQEWSLLEWCQQDHGSSLSPPPAAIAHKGYVHREWPSMENCTIHIRWDTLQEYASALSKKFQENLSRQMRNLLAAGNVQWLASSDPTVTPALLELYLRIEPRSWKSQAGASIGRHAQRVAYFKGLLDRRQPMRISIQLLILDGVPIAGLVTGSFAKGLYALHIVYDDGLRRLAPGSAILLMGMRQAIEEKYAFFNLLSGFDYFKVRWLAKVTETRVAQMYRAGSLLFWHRVLGDCRRKALAIQHKTAPFLFNPARRDVSAQKKLSSDHKTSVLALNAAEQARNSELIAEVRRGQCEWLTAAELATAIQLDSKRITHIKGRLQKAASFIV